MKNRRALIVTSFLVCMAVFGTRRADAIAIVDMGIAVSNPQVLTTAGSVEWLMDWNATAFAMGMDTHTPFVMPYDTDPDRDGEVFASVSTVYVADAAVRTSANSLEGGATIQAASPNSSGDAWGNAQSVLRRAFVLTGGQGLADTLFSFDYNLLINLSADSAHEVSGILGAHFYITELGSGLERSLGFDYYTTVWGSFLTDARSGSYAETLALSYGTQYLLEVVSTADGRITPQSVPDGGATVALLLFGMVAVGAARSRIAGF